MISIKQLNYALNVEKTLHFRKAAELSNVSQSTMSTALNELEKHLDIQVFERDNKKVLVTPMGKEVLKIARNILLQIEDIQHLAAGQTDPLDYPLTIGAIPTIAPYLLPKILPQLAIDYPKAQLNIVEEQSHILVNKVREGEIDAAILALPFPCDGLMTLEFWQEDFYWIAASDTLDSPMQEITSDEMSHSNLMLLEDGHCLKDHILDACSISQSDTSQQYRATSLNTLIQLVASKVGTTLVPAMALDQICNKDAALTAVHLNEKSPHRRLAFIFRPNYTRLASLQTLAELCKQQLK